MPTLHWIGKEKVINHHLDIPYHTLNKEYDFNYTVPGTTETGNEKNPVNQSNPDNLCSDNKIIHADNLLALKSLLPEYEGRIKCIYIDPPYNTGNESWVYNDNVNDPRIKKWINDIVGKEGDDLTRHDKWLCMMYPRLKLLHKLLSADGVIFISIDDNELSNLKILMDEIFGTSNFIEYFSWIKTSTAPSLATKSRKTSEYVLCYERRRNNRKYKAEEGDGGDAPLLNSGNASVELVFPKSNLYFKIPNGKYEIGQYEKLHLNNQIVINDGFADEDIKLTGEFKWTQTTLDNEINNGTTFIIKSEKFSIRYLRETETYKAPTNLLKEKYFTSVIDKKEADVDTNEGAKKEILSLFGKHVFDYPKPSTLIEFFLKLVEDKNCIVLDSFAGSGTTAHAVLNLNKQDGGNRKFILIEMENYAETITAERVKRVIKGYSETEGTGGSFSFYTLGERVLDDEQNLNPNLSVEKIHRYIWYSETHQPYIQQANTAGYLGKYSNTGYYFYYQPNEVTTLDDAYLMNVTELCEQYVMYADVCLLSEKTMLQHNIIFKKIPRDISKL